MKEGIRSKINESVARLFLNSRFDILFILIITTLTIGTIFYHSIEGWTILDSLYFSVITLSTVGYGDFSPITPIGRLFTIFYIIVGIGIILGFINFITDQALKYKIRDKTQKKMNKNVSKEIQKRRKETRKRNIKLNKKK